MSLSDRLRTAIKARNMSIADLIRRVDISKAGIYFILDGTSDGANIRYTTVMQVCKALKIRHEWLMDGTGGMDIAQSQPLRIDADTIADAQEALAAIARIEGISGAEATKWASDPERIAMAIDAVLQVAGDAADASNIIDLMAIIKQRMRGGRDAAEKGKVTGSNTKASGKSSG